MEACCEAFDRKTTTTCKCCGARICGKCRSRIERISVCSECRELVEARLEHERAGAKRVGPGFLGGLVGALIGGAAWAAVAIVTEVEHGSAALLVGLFAGLGVHRGSGKGRGIALQLVAVACSLIGLLIGRYLNLVAFIRSRTTSGSDSPLLDEFRYFHENMWEGFRWIAPERFSGFSGFDYILVALGITVAWGVLQPTNLWISRRRR